MSAEEDLKKLQERLKQLEAAAGAPSSEATEGTGGDNLLDRCKALEERLEQASNAIESESLPQASQNEKSRQPRSAGTQTNGQPLYNTKQKGKQQEGRAPLENMTNGKVHTKADGDPQKPNEHHGKKSKQQAMKNQPIDDESKQDNCACACCCECCGCCCHECSDDEHDACDDSIDDESIHYDCGCHCYGKNSMSKRRKQRRSFVDDIEGDDRVHEMELESTQDDSADELSQEEKSYPGLAKSTKTTVVPATNRRRHHHEKKHGRLRNSSAVSRRMLKKQCRGPASVVRAEPSERELRSSSLRRMHGGNEAAQELWRELRDNQSSWSKERVLLRRDADRQRRTALGLERELERAEQAEREATQENKRLKAALQERDRWIKSVERKQGRAEQDKERELTRFKSNLAQVQAERDSLRELLAEASDKLEAVESNLATAAPVSATESQLSSEEQQGQQKRQMVIADPGDQSASARSAAVNTIRETLERLQQVLQPSSATT